MDPTLVAGIILLVGTIGLLCLGVPIAIAVIVPTMVSAIMLTDFDRAVLTVSQQMFGGVYSFTLLAIPLFVLAGLLMSQGGIAARLVDLARLIAGRMPGALAQTNVIAGVFFGSVSGSAVASTAAIGTVMLPEMKRAGYDPRFSAAVNLVSAPNGLLIPPSNTFIIYSLVSSTSIGALFLAGYGPGIVWTIACLIVVHLYARKRSDLTDHVRFTLRECLFVIWRAVPALLMIMIVVGGILIGFFTPTESAAIAVAYCLVLSLLYRSIRLRDLWGILLSATRTTAIVMLLVAVSTAMAWVMSYASVPQLLSRAITDSIDDNRVLFLLLIGAFLLAVGTFMDSTPAILIFTPIFLPIASSVGIDPIHFGTVVVYALSVGTITPPVGTVLLVGTQVAGLRIEPVLRFMVPFLVAIVGLMLLVMFIPALSLWLPQQFGLIAG